MQIQDAPNIVHVYDCLEANNTAYSIMEFLEGETLKHILDREGSMPTEKALDWI